MKKPPTTNNYLSVIFWHPTTSNISSWWNFGSLLGVCWILQIITGLFQIMNQT